MPRYLLLALGAALFVVLPVQAAEPAPAVVEIVLPPNAKLYLGDDLIRSRPGTHRLDTPPLQQGKSYTYEFRIEIEHDGKTETFTRKLSLFGLAKRRKPTSPISLKAPPKPDQPKPVESTADKPKPPDKPKPDKPATTEFKMSDLEPRAFSTAPTPSARRKICRS